MSNGGEKVKLGYEMFGTLCLQQVCVGIHALNSLSRTVGAGHGKYLVPNKLADITFAIWRN